MKTVLRTFPEGEESVFFMPDRLRIAVLSNVVRHRSISAVEHAQAAQTRSAAARPTGAGGTCFRR
jgi:hypothetical protein